MAEQLKTKQKLRILKTGHGDLCLAQWELTDSESVTLARSLFEENFTSGRLAFRIDGPGRTTLIKSFDEAAPEILIVPTIQGGGFY
ncbi:MAG: hypothetical protein DWI24_11495 [Planctomycetota bacterium]|nr:MAG: hypothetical protein DWI24_11495 [Planctomycetota bacterium]